MIDKIDYWNNCYDLTWKNLITPASFSHPAKFSRGLIFRIIEHALEDGLIQPGGIILDPFGGVALGALPSLMNGLSWVGMELEEKFCSLGRENIALWNSKFSSMPKWTGQAQIIQGDSRRLAEVVQGAGLGQPVAVVSSPPYAAARIQQEGGDNLSNMRRASDNGIYGLTGGQLAGLPEGQPPVAVVSSPPFAGNTGGRGEASRNGIDAALFDRHSGGMKRGTGSDPANLDHLPQGNIQAVIASPPYADQPTRNGKVDENAWSDGRSRPVGASQRESKGYGGAPGQLGAMKAGAVIGSPPFMGQTPGSSKPAYETRPDGSPFGAGRSMESDYDEKIPYEKRGFLMGKEEYQKWAQTCNLGSITSSQETFWSAARQIVEQCALILPSGAASIWVVKNYVKKGVEVDFTGQWQALCEACGFETVHIHRAWLVKRRGSQATMDGGSVSLDTSKKSFFRRLSEKNGAPPIDFETVLCMRRV